MFGTFGPTKEFALSPCEIARRAPPDALAALEHEPDGEGREERGGRALDRLPDSAAARGGGELAASSASSDWQRQRSPRDRILPQTNLWRPKPIASTLGSRH
jgi:hypothetical protein